MFIVYNKVIEIEKSKKINASNNKIDLANSRNA